MPLSPPVLPGQGLQNTHENLGLLRGSVIVQSKSCDWRSIQGRTEVRSQGGTRSRDLRQEWSRDRELQKASAVSETNLGSTNGL